jgi:hypothetical protein
MAKNDGDDPYGSTETTTQYEGEHHPAPKGGIARSAWALALAAGFLLVLGGWIILRPHGATDPAPGGSAGSGSVTTPGPATQSQ